jgi:putative effector of murein hydrolase LrgA (UPF0299 family)
MKLFAILKTMLTAPIGYVLVLFFLLLGFELNEWFALDLPHTMLGLVLIGLPLGALIEMRNQRR